MLMHTKIGGLSPLVAGAGEKMEKRWDMDRDSLVTGQVTGVKLSAPPG